MEKVFEIPELAGWILEYLDPSTIQTLRLVSRALQTFCRPYFALTLDTEKEQHLSHLVHVFRANRLYLIQALRIGSPLAKRGGRWGIDHFVPKGLEFILNQIPPVRHVHITEIESVDDDWFSRGWVERSIVPAQLTWRMPTSRKEEEEEGEEKKEIGILSSATADERAGHQQKDSPSCNPLPLSSVESAKSATERPLSRMELLPLEAPWLLSRLETLSVRFGKFSPQNLDPLLVRLSQSVARRTLRSLVLGADKETEATRDVSWGVFRPCVLALQALRILDLENIKICRRALDDIAEKERDKEAEEVLLTADEKTDHRARVPRTSGVQKLRFNCSVNSEMKRTILAFFSNVQSLEMSAVKNLWDEDVDRALDSFQLLNGPTTPAGQVVPFPRLKTLQVPISTVHHWTANRLFRLWATQRPLKLDHVHFSGLASSTCALAKALSQDSVTLKRARIVPFNRDSCAEILTQSCFRALKELEISNRSLEEWTANGIEIITKALSDRWKVHHPDSFPHPLPTTASLQFSKRESIEAARVKIVRHQLTRARMIEYLPWTATLTKLHLGHISQSYSFYRHSRPTSLWLGRILQLMPHLDDFALFKALPDLEFFDGIGRCCPLPCTLLSVDSSLDGTNQQHLKGHNFDAPPGVTAAKADKNKGIPLLLDNWTGERPFLTYLAVHQANTVDDDDLVSWRAFLEHKFRFLKVLSLTRESEEGFDYEEE